MIFDTYTSFGANLALGEFALGKYGSGQIWVWANLALAKFGSGQTWHTRIAGHSLASTIAACELLFATFIFDGQSNVVVQMFQFLCVINHKSIHNLKN